LHHTSKIAGISTELTYTLEQLTDQRIVIVGRNDTATSTETVEVSGNGVGSTITYTNDLSSTVLRSSPRRWARWCSRSWATTPRNNCPRPSTGSAAGPLPEAESGPPRGSRRDTAAGTMLVSERLAHIEGLGLVRRVQQRCCRGGW